MTEHPTPPRVVSYGGGVQSTALLVLAAQGRIDFPTFLMANVGDDSEDPRTLEYVRDVAGPYAAAHGIALHLLQKYRPNGDVDTLWSRIMNAEANGDGRRPSIPIRMENGAPTARACTAEYKMQVVARWTKEHGAYAGARCKGHRKADKVPTGGCLPPPRHPGHRWHLPFDVQHDKGHDCDRGPRPDCPDCDQPRQAVVALGISLDEIRRANTGKNERHERKVYPLVGLGEESGLKMTRQDCMALIARAGLPVPPKSSCFFCPFHRPQVWVELRRERPDLFEKSVQMERAINDRRRRVGAAGNVYLTRFGMPLDEAIGQPEAMLPGLGLDSDVEGECDSGFCFT